MTVQTLTNSFHGSKEGVIITGNMQKIRFEQIFHAGSKPRSDSRVSTLCQNNAVASPCESIFWVSSRKPDLPGRPPRPEQSLPQKDCWGYQLLPEGGEVHPFMDARFTDSDAARVFRRKTITSDCWGPLRGAAAQRTPPHFLSFGLNSSHPWNSQNSSLD